MKISIVDQSPIFSNSNPNIAIDDTLALAKHADSIGLERFWVAEHHGSNSFAGCSPEILIPRLASQTESIRIGSGGVMLMHYSPYKVSENFLLLESMFPGRIDLGIGRAPGSDPYQAGALAYGSKTTGPEFFTTKMQDLRSFLLGKKSSTNSFESVEVTPGLGKPPELWLLVSSQQGAEFAAHFGLPMSLAYFINSDCLHLAKYYRDNFSPSTFSKVPRISIGIFALCAETDREANELSLSASLWKQNMKTGKFLAFPTLKEAKEQYALGGDDEERKSLIGSKNTIQEKLQPILEECNPEELKIVTICEPLSSRMQSYSLLKEVFE